jgi:ribonuclease T2
LAALGNPVGNPLKKWQPLFGLNKHIKPLYVRDVKTNLTGNCEIPFATDFCKISVRNMPHEGWEPAFVVWPLTTEHVQSAVNFARKHQLCVSVAGTGHDFLNRHSSNNGMMIRTSLLKKMTWNSDETAKLGSGLTFSEIIKAASEQSPSRVVTTGWATGVGVAGWSLGGGHGPLVNSQGLGVDNLVEVELVLANGTLVTASKSQNPELLWALRGGGGSAWGVMTSLTVRTYPQPAGGFVLHDTVATGSYRKRGMRKLEAHIDHVFDWCLGLSEKWGGLMMLVAIKTGWTVLTHYWYKGPKTDTEYIEQTTKLHNSPAIRIHFNEASCENWWRCNLPQKAKLDPIEAWVIPEKTPSVDVIPSVLLSRGTVTGSNFRDQVKGWFKDCSTFGVHSCGITEVYHDLPHENTVKKLPAGETSISDEFRHAMLHWISPPQKRAQARFLPLGGASYFAESAYIHSGDSWKRRYWGDNYDRLLAVKKAYDPDNFFWCRHCVGSDLPRGFSHQVKEVLV